MDLRNLYNFGQCEYKICGWYTTVWVIYIYNIINSILRHKKSGVVRQMVVIMGDIISYGYFIITGPMTFLTRLRILATFQI